MEVRHEIGWKFLRRFDERFSGDLMDGSHEVGWKFLRRFDGSLSDLMKVSHEV